MKQIINDPPALTTLNLVDFTGQYKITNPIAYLTEGKKRIAVLQHTHEGYGFIYLHKLLHISMNKESHFTSYCVKGAVTNAVTEGRVVLSFKDYTEFLEYALEHNLLNKD